MLDVKVLYCGKWVQRGVTDLLDWRKLPIRFSAWDWYPKSSRWKSDAGEVIIELHKRITFSEFGCTIDELGEPWGVKIYLIEESYSYLVEFIGVDAGHDVL